MGEEGLEMTVIDVFLFSCIGVPLVNLLCKIVTWLKFLDIPTYMVQECKCVVQDT